MRRQRNADATRKRRVNARWYVSRRKAMSYHRGFSERTDGYFAFRVNSIVAKKKKEERKKEKRTEKRRITKNNSRFDRKKYGKMQNNAFAKWHRVLSKIRYFKISVIRRLWQANGSHRPSYDARDINQLSSNRRALQTPRLFLAKCFPVKISTIDASVT